MIFKPKVNPIDTNISDTHSAIQENRTWEKYGGTIAEGDPLDRQEDAQHLEPVEQGQWDTALCGPHLATFLKWELQNISWCSDKHDSLVWLRCCCWWSVRSCCCKYCGCCHLWTLHGYHHCIHQGCHQHPSPCLNRQHSQRKKSRWGRFRSSVYLFRSQGCI